MSEMIDRAARKLSKQNADGCEEDGHIEACDPDLCSCRRIARIVVQEIRDPTAQMLVAAAPIGGPPDIEDYELAAKALMILPPTEHPDIADVLAAMVKDWRTMIDEALK